MKCPVFVIITWDEMQLHFKNFCLHYHSCNGQQSNYTLNPIATKGNHFLIIEDIFDATGN